MRSFRINPWSAVAGAGAVAYPFLVWFGRTKVPPAGFVLIGVACIAARMIATRRLVRSPVEVTVFLLAAAMLVGLLAVSPTLAARSYPVAISLAVATIFAASLRFPPTVIERIARLTEPDLPPEGVIYTRKVTVVWVAFLLVNAAISLWTALCGSLEQ